MSQTPGNLPELIGTTVLDTIGLVIAAPDEQLRNQMHLPDDIRALGMISSRTGAAGQLVACDEAVKSTNTVLVSAELPRDTKGWGGHGCYIILGAHSVDDAARAVRIALDEIQINAGEVHISQAGHLEFAYSARSGQVLQKVFQIPTSQAFGFAAGSPAAIGQVMADRALKAANIQICKYMTPDSGTSHSNEVIVAFSGSTDAVKEAVLTAKRIGMELLSNMGSAPQSPSEPFLF